MTKTYSVYCPMPGCHAYWTIKFHPEGWTEEERDRLLDAHDRLAHPVPVAGEKHPDWCKCSRICGGDQ